MSVGISVLGEQNFVVIKNLSGYGVRPILLDPFVLTARQYGEVVLPDASTGQSPGTLAGKLSRCKEGMACVFAVQVQSWLNITHVAVQTFKVTEKLSWYCYFINSTGAVSRYNLSRSQKLVKVRKFDCEFWREVRVPRSAGIVLVAGAKAKTMTNNLPILSVLWGVYFFYETYTNSRLIIVHLPFCFSA